MKVWHNSVCSTLNIPMESMSKLCNGSYAGKNPPPPSGEYSYASLRELFLKSHHTLATITVSPQLPSAASSQGLPLTKTSGQISQPKGGLLKSVSVNQLQSVGTWERAGASKQRRKAPRTIIKIPQISSSPLTPPKSADY